MRLVDRDDQMSVLERLSAASAAGDSQVVLLQAEVCHGKTTLLRAFSEKAEADGFCWLYARCSPDEHAVPFAVLSQLLVAADLPMELQSRVRTLLEQADVDDFALLNGFLFVVEELARRRPVLLAVDDVEYADGPSIRVLLWLVRRLRRARVMWTLTRTTGTSETALTRLPNAHHLDLPPLSRKAVDEVVAGAYAFSGGNPALVQALRVDSVDGMAYREAVTECLRRCDPLVAEAASALFLLGTKSSPSALAGLLDIGRDDLDRALARLDGIGLVHNGVPRHPVVGQAASDLLTAQRRAQMHRRAARLSHDQGLPAVDVARHVVAAGQPSESWIEGVLVAAADHALANDDVRFAVEALTFARRTVPVLARLALAEWHLNPAAVVRHAEPLVAAVRSGSADEATGAELVRYLIWHGRTDQAREVLDRLRGRSFDGLADLELWLMWACPPLVVGRRDTHCTGGRRQTAGDPWLRSAATLTRALTLGERPVISRGVQPRFGHGSPWSIEPAGIALLALVNADQAAAAESACARLVAEAERRDAPTWLATLSAVGATIALRLGDLATAADRAGNALEIIPAGAWGVAIGSPLASLILAATLRGDHDDAARHVNQPVPHTMFASTYAPFYLYARGYHHLATQQHHAALADFLRCGELQRAWGLDLPGLVPWRIGVAESWLGLGKRDRARRAAFDQLATTEAGSSRARALALRVLATTEPKGRRTQLLMEAVDILEACGDRLELAHALAELSRAYRGIGREQRARMIARRATHVAKACGAGTLQRKLSAAAGPIPDEPPSVECVDSLTGSERRVAALAVAGYTNREIAGKLFITPSTVEQHLTRVYRKLHVKYRGNLPAQLHADLATSA